MIKQVKNLYEYEQHKNQSMHWKINIKTEQAHVSDIAIEACQHLKVTWHAMRMLLNNLLPSWLQTEWISKYLFWLNDKTSNAAGKNNRKYDFYFYLLQITGRVAILTLLIHRILGKAINHISVGFHDVFTLQIHMQLKENAT